MLHQLKDEHLMRISARIAALAHTAADSSDPRRAVALAEMKWNFWRWTADGFDTAESVIRIDSIKYCLRHLVHSRNAALHEGEESRRDLRHEHAVPGHVLARVIIESDKTVERVNRILTSLCHAVVLTKTEDAQLRGHKLLSAMPETWDGLDPWARYRTANLLSELQKPDGTYCSLRIPLS